MILELLLAATTAFSPWHGAFDQSTALQGWDVKAVSTATLPAAPQYYIAASIDFDEGGVVDGESIGATHNVCPSSDSVTTTCLGQSTVADRPTWQQAADCRAGQACWTFDTTDFFGGTGSSIGLAADWDWLSSEPTICHWGGSYDATTSALVGMFGNKSTSGASKGTIAMVDTRTTRSAFVSIAGTSAVYNNTTCFSGVDETAPFLFTFQLLGTGAGEWETFINGVSCGASTAVYATPAAARVAVPYIYNIYTDPGQANFLWCDTETSGTTVAGMQTRAAAAQVILAAQIGVTLP